MRFFIGTDMVNHAQHFDACMISVNRLRNRRSHFKVNDWIMDSGAFMALSSGKGHRKIGIYAHDIWRYSNCGNLLAAVTQDYMCEPFILEKTGLDVKEHQQRTIDRYVALKTTLQQVSCATYIMPVLQGYTVQEYLNHAKMYKGLLSDWQWIGVGSICKRNGNPDEVFAILDAIKREYPTLLLHGFGLKITALGDSRIRHLLYSADSQSWSYANWRTPGKRPNGNCNRLKEAQEFLLQVQTLIDRE